LPSVRGHATGCRHLQFCSGKILISFMVLLDQVMT